VTFEIAKKDMNRNSDPEYRSAAGIAYDSAGSVQQRINNESVLF
jgi:hypothetical protein